MRERRYWKVAPLIFVLAATVFGTPGVARGQGSPLAKAHSSLPESPSRDVIVIEFVGGFVSRDDAKHPEVQFAAYLRDRYPSIHAEVFGNHHGQKALHQVVRLLDTDHDGSLTSIEKARATVILYGHSWGASETVALARELGEMGIPVALTIQIDTIAKPGHKSAAISANVASAINFYQTGGPLHGRPEIVAADPARTKIIGNFRMNYVHRPIDCDNYSWYARHFNKPHHEIENDLRVWDEATRLIASDLQGSTPIVPTPSPSSSPFFEYLRRGVQANIAAIAPLNIASEQESNGQAMFATDVRPDGRFNHLDH
jgi:pimeloyl-ACP methyl ester carboxylesterase